MKEGVRKNVDAFLMDFLAGVFFMKTSSLISRKNFLPLKNRNILQFFFASKRKRYNMQSFCTHI